MRYFFSILLIMALLVGCSTQQEATVTKPEETTEVLVSTEPLEETVPEIVYEMPQELFWDELLEITSAEHKALLEIENPFAGFDEYLVNDSAVPQFSADEIKTLKYGSMPRKAYITYEEAVSDIETVFRVCHAAYGAYYYFGEEAFENAKAEILQWLEGQTTVDVSQLEWILREKTSFMCDGHSYLGRVIWEVPGVCYAYYNCLNQAFSRDEQGYYKTENGTKWYLESFSNDFIQVKPALQADGTILYEPVLFTPNGMTDDDVLTLRNSQDQTRTETLQWEETAALGGGDNPDFRYLDENNITYISMRAFRDSEDKYKALYQEFMQTGKRAQNSDLLIFDLRSNSGGNGDSMNTWLRNFSGQSPQIPEIKSDRASALQDRNPVSRSKFSKAKITNGKWIPNDIPVIVLVDDRCGSAGEFALNLLRTMDNVLVVGSNTAGCQLGGNAIPITLPNSRIYCQIGTQLRFAYDITNVDDTGYEPDVWCNPSTSLEAVLNMLKQNDLTSLQTVTSLYEQLDGIALNRHNITLQFANNDVQPGNGFGAPQLMDYYIPVFADGEQTGDFTVEYEDNGVCICEKTADGQLLVRALDYGYCAISITVEKTTANFTWVCLQ